MMASPSPSDAKEGFTRVEKEIDEVWRDLQALKKLYGLVYQNKGNSPHTQAQDSLDEKSKLLLKKLLDEATQKAIESQSKLLLLQTSCAPEPLVLGKSTDLLKLEEDGNKNEMKIMPFTFQAKDARSADCLHHDPDHNHQDRRMVSNYSSKSATTKNFVSSDIHAKTSSCNVPSVTQKLPVQLLTRRVIQEAQLTSGPSLPSEPDHKPLKRSRLHTPAQTPSRVRKEECRVQTELTQKESLKPSTDLVPLRPKKDGDRNSNVKEGNTLPCRMPSLKDGRMKQADIPDQMADNILRKNHADKMHLRKQRSDLSSLKSEKPLIKRDQVSFVKPDQSHATNLNLEERRQLNQIGGRIHKPNPHGSKQRVDPISKSSSLKPDQTLNLIPVSKTARRGLSPTSSRRKASPKPPRQMDETQKRTGWEDSPYRKGRVRRVCSPRPSTIRVSHSGTSRRTSSMTRSESSSISETRSGRQGKRNNRKMIEWKMMDCRQVERPQKKKSMPRQMQALHFHHHRHQGHVDGEDQHRSTWQYLRGIFRHASKEDKIYGGKPAAEREPRNSQHGYPHALMEGLLRHVWHTRQRKAAKAAERKRLRKATSLARGKQKKKPHWWHRLYGREGVKLASRNKPRLRLGFGQTHKFVLAKNKGKMGAFSKV